MNDEERKFPVKIIILIVAGVLVLTGLGFWFWQSQNKVVETAPAPTSTGVSTQPQTLSITISSPKKNEIIEAGQTYKIGWTSALPSDAKIKITLKKTGSESLIKDGLDNTGSYDWNIDANIAPGMYSISIAYTNPQGAVLKSQESDKFAITNKKSATKFIFPLSSCDDQLQAGQTNTIIWNVSASDESKNFYLFARRASVGVRITEVSGKDRHYDWKITAGQIQNGSYDLILGRNSSIQSMGSVAKGGFFLGETDCYKK